MAYIKVIQHDEAAGRLKEIYDDLVAKRGKLAEVHKIQGLNPESIVNHMDLYMTIMFGKSPLKRYQREMMAVVVSVHNNCHYCQVHHGHALNYFWKDMRKVELLRNNFAKVQLSEVDRKLCQLAEDLTRRPGVDHQSKQIESLKALGLDDRAILDATLVIAYFNFVNRMVLGLGIELEKEGRDNGYKFD